MSNDLAIATVTTTLRQLLQMAVAYDDLGAATISLERPDLVKPKDGEMRVNLFLYQAVPNAYWRNADLPTRTSSGAALRRPQAAFDLHFLLSFYGSEPRLVPQRLLGRTLSALHAQPMLTSAQVSAAVQAAAKNRDDAYLAASDLAQQVDRVTLSPLGLSLEELSKLWSVFLQTPYALSVAYSASVVLIEGRAAVAAPAPPVRTVSLYSQAARPPVVSAVEPARPGDAITAGSPIVIRGVGLGAARVQLRIDAQMIDLASAGDSRIELSALPAGLPAGVHGISVLHLIPRDDGPPLAAAESNLAAFVLRPRISDPRYVAPTQGTDTVLASPPYVTLVAEPPVAAGQRVSLLLSSVAVDGASYNVSGPTDLAGAALQLPIGGVVPGEYAVRLRVDGAESLPDPATDGGPAGPRVVVLGGGRNP
jgi:hypothetical protein